MRDEKSIFSESASLARSAAPSGFHAAFLIVLCLFLVGQPFIRNSNGLPFLGFVGVAICYALASSRPVLVKPLLAFTLLGLMYIGYSYLDALPDAWTRIYDPSTIPRQAFYVILLYPLVLSARSMWSYANRSRRLARFFLAIILSVAAAAPLVQATLLGEGLQPAFIGTLTRGLANAQLLLYIAGAYFLLVYIKNTRLAQLLTVVLAASVLGFLFYKADSPQVQNVFAITALLVARFAQPGRKVVLVTVAGVALVYLMLIPFAHDIYVADPNSGYRLALTKDALGATAESYGLGVGFGKEVIANTFREYGIGPSAVTNPLLEGVHNSFAQEFMRLGLLGGAFLVWLVFGTCLPPSGGSISVRRHISFVYFVVIISMMADVSLESPTYIVGLAWGIGYIIACKEQWRVPATSQDASRYPHTRPRERSPGPTALCDCSALRRGESSE